MPEYIERLRSSLLHAVARSLSLDEFIGKPEVIAGELAQVRATFNRKATAAPPEDRIFNAISAFLHGRILENGYQAGLIAWGLYKPHGQQQPLLELAEPFSRFLDQIRQFSREDQLSPKTLRGLVSSYFCYPGPTTATEVGRANWGLLRSFLRELFPAFALRRARKPAWILVLDQHVNLLDPNPCQRYAQGALEGNTEILQKLREDLAIPGTSWFVEELIRAQVELGCSFEDRGYKQYLPQLCETLRKNEIYINHTLPGLLARYHKCNDRSEHVELARLAIDSWGNPKLPRNTMWGGVSPEVKAMVLKWLISKDLRIFFDLFSSDLKADQDRRRLDFWMRYLDSIQDAYFGLGNHAYKQQQEDYLEVMRRNKERVARLDDAGNPKNNAFIMLVGRYAIVEFGMKGNACFCFKLDNLPFNLGDARLAGDKSQLKNQHHRGCQFRLIHNDDHEKWEDKFEEELRRLGIYPDSASGEIGGRQIYKRPSWVAPRPAAFKMDELQKLANFCRLTVRDLRSKGGYLWVESDNVTPEVQAILTRWGFQLKPGIGWYLK